MYYKQKMSKYCLIFLLGVCFTKSALNSRGLLQDFEGFEGSGLKGPLYSKLDRFLSYLRKRTFSRNDHLMSFAFTAAIRCHSLSLAVPLIVTRCHSLNHSLFVVVPFIVICCRTMYRSSVIL